MSDLVEPPRDRFSCDPWAMLCENKDTVELRGNNAADQRLRFCYIDRTTALLPKSEFSCLYPSSVMYSLVVSDMGGNP